MNLLASLLFWPALLLCLPQALYVRHTARRFGAADGPPAGCFGRGRRLRLLGVGDSIIAGVGANGHAQGLVATVAEHLAGRFGRSVEWTALGEIGADAAGVRRLFQAAAPPSPVDCLLVSVGVNDTTGLSALRRWRRELRELLRELHAHSPTALVLLLGLPPMHGFPLLPVPLRWVLGWRARQLDTVARRVAGELPWVRFLEVKFDTRPEQFSADGYHPSAAAYRELGKSLAAAVAAQWPAEAAGANSETAEPG